MYKLEGAAQWAAPCCSYCLSGLSPQNVKRNVRIVSRALLSYT